jgi:hypothetical protein
MVELFAGLLGEGVEEWTALRLDGFNNVVTEA